jgi:hypothetical protein
MSVPDKNASQLKTKSWVGFYGCEDRLVRVGWDGVLPRGKHSRDFGRFGPRDQYRDVRPNSVSEMDCPACKRVHSVSLMWRPRTDEDTIDIYV